MSGQIVDMSWEEYRNAPGMNASLLESINDSAAHMKAQIDGVAKKQESKDLSFGSLFHAWILEPETVQSTFHLRPDVIADENGEMQPWHGAKKACKEWVKSHSDKPIVTSEDIVKVRGMTESLRANPEFIAHFEGGKSEQSLFAIDKHGTNLKGRIDRLKLTGNILIDLKTCGSCTEADFQRDIENFGYYRKAAFYIDLANLCGLSKEVFIFVAIEKEPPYIHALWKLPADWLKYGRRHYQDALKEYRECVRTGVWPGPADQPRTISPSIWSQKLIDDIC